MEASIELDIIESLLMEGRPLSRLQAELLASQIASDRVSPEEKMRLMISLNEKGETLDEILGFASLFRGLATHPPLENWRGSAIDIVGTGGSKSGGYNFSSAASLLTAAYGIPVIKHGNRAITSKSGAADFLGTLGIPQQVPMDVLIRSMEAIGFCFLFAPAFHPAFREVAPVRKLMAEAGRRSIFNILGPLINPARPAFQLLGVYAKDQLEHLASVQHDMGLHGGLTIFCELSDGSVMDELTTAGRNWICGFGSLKGIHETFTAADVGLDTAAPVSVKGGLAAENVERFVSVLKGHERGGLRDSICLNTGAALWITGAASSLKAGVQTIQTFLDTPKPLKWLNKAQAFYEAERRWV
jgi:anthranilate phosphoribosyltransferase